MMAVAGLWGKDTAFNDAKHFINSIESRGQGAMGMVAMDLKGKLVRCNSGDARAVDR